MPVASYRSTFGVQKDGSSTYLTAAVAAGATTIPVNGTSVPASSTIYFVDGPNTEQRAVTGGGGSSSLTVAALTNAHPAGTRISWQLTASLGPADYIPVTVLEHEDTIAQLQDKGLRGSAGEEWANVQGTRFAQLTIGGDVFPDLIGYFVGGVTGAADFTGGTPNVHTFALKNTGDTQPTDLAFTDFNAIDTRGYFGARCEELTLNWDPAGLFTYQAKIKSWTSGPLTATTASYSAQLPAPTWQIAAQIGGSSVLYVMKAAVTIKRPAMPVFTVQGIQDPYKMWQGPSTVEGSMTVVMEDNTQLNNFLNNSQPALDLLWTASGANPNTIRVHSTKANFESGKPKQTGTTAGFVELDVTFRGLMNATDANTAGTGSAPVKVTVGCTKATGTYL